MRRLLKFLFHWYSSRTMLWPSRYAATENSTAIVGTCVGGAFFSKIIRPFVKTSSTTAGSQIRGRKSVLIIHW